MTIAVVVKVNDGIVFASDSATTMIQGGNTIANVYNNANKIFNLRKGLPIGAMTFGAGSIGHASISTLAKDFRRRLSGKSKQHADWRINPDNYKIEDVARRAREFLFDEKYAAHLKAGGAPFDAFGLWIGGYSADSGLPELWGLEIVSGKVNGPTLLQSHEQIGIAWAGEPEALNRMLNGYSQFLPAALVNGGLDEASVRSAFAVAAPQVAGDLVSAPMPIQDAIDLARFCVELTANFVRFRPGAPTVGGPTELAAVTKHEGFKWAARKHYFVTGLNPELDWDCTDERKEDADD